MNALLAVSLRAACSALACTETKTAWLKEPERPKYDGCIHPAGQRNFANNSFF